MKLIVCLDCLDVVNLTKQTRFCHCKRSSGAYYSDGKSAWYTGNAKPVGINNNKLMHLLTGMKSNIELFSIQDDCVTFKKIQEI